MGGIRRRSSCCRKFARSTPTRPASSRCRRQPTRRSRSKGLGGELKPFQRAGVTYMLGPSAAPSSLTSRGSARRSRRSRRSRPTAPTRRSSCAGQPQAQLAAGESSAGCRGAACALLEWSTGKKLLTAGGDHRSSTTTSSRRAWMSCARWSPSRWCWTSRTLKNAAAKRTQAVQRLASGGAERRPGDGADRHSGDEPAPGVDRAAADPRAPCRLRLGRKVRPGASAGRTRTCACTGICARAASCAA